MDGNDTTINKLSYLITIAITNYMKHGQMEMTINFICPCRNNLLDKTYQLAPLHSVEFGQH